MSWPQAFPFRCGKLAPPAYWKISDFNRSNSGPNQFQNFRAERFDHPADLAVAAFCDGDFEKSVAGRIANAVDDCGARGTVRQLNAGSKTIELIVGEKNGALDQVGFWNLGFRAGDVIAEIGVVGHDEEAAGVLIEAANREEPFAGSIVAGEEIVDGGATFGIFVSGQIALGFIEQQVDFFGSAERAAIEGDAGAIDIDPGFRRARDFAVDGDAAGGDPLAGLGAGADSGF